MGIPQTFHTSKSTRPLVQSEEEQNPMKGKKKKTKQNIPLDNPQLCQRRYSKIKEGKNHSLSFLCIAASPEMHDTFLTISRNLILQLTQITKREKPKM